MAATPKRNTPTKRRTPTAATRKRKTPSLSTTTTTSHPDPHPKPHRINHRTTTLPPLISDVTTAISAANTFLHNHDTLLLPSLTLSLHSSLSSTSTSLSHLRSLLSLPSPSPPPLPPPSVSLSPLPSPWFERFVLSSITDSDPRWAQTFRMSKPTFSLLSSTLSHSLSSALPDIPPHFALGCALYRLAHAASFSFIGRRFGFSSKDACRAFYTVCKVICADLGGYFGHFINDILMLNCCGVLGFEKFGIEGNGEVLGEDGFLIVQALVDSDGRFLDVSAGWPSIFSTVSVLRQSRLYSAVEESKELLNGPEVELFDGHSVPQYVLGESWYRSLPWVVTPFAGKGEGLGLSSSEVMFNEVHRRGMGFIKVAFGRVRANWQLLNRRWKDELVEFLPFLITTACLLNNFLLKHGEVLPDIDLGTVEETEEKMLVRDGDVSESAAKIRNLLALHLSRINEHAGRKVDGLMKWKEDDHIDVNKRRSIAENAANKSSPLILAAKNTNRQDPLDDFKHYTGGWNISNKHYWTSVAYTAAPFFIVAAVWFVIFGLSLICSCLYYCCCRKAPYGYSRVCYALSLIFLILFTVAAIVGCIFLYTGQAKFHTSTTKTLRYVVSQADYTVDNLNNVSDYLSDAKAIGVGEMVLPEMIQNQISDVQTKLQNAANTLQVKTEDNSKKMQRVLDQVRLILIILAAVMLSVAFVGFLLSIFGLQCLLYTLIVLGWILVTLTFIMSGIFLVLHNVVADTCIAMEQWVQNPQAHTALDDILPCVDKATAQLTLTRSKQVTYQLTMMVDTVIGTIANSDPAPNTIPPLNYNQSGPFVPNLCSPLNQDLTNRTCRQGEVDFGNADQVWKNYVCEAKRVNKNEICTTTGRLTPTLYSQMNSAENVAFGLYHYTPFLVDVQDCTFVRSTFSNFSTNYCPGLRKYTQWIYIGLVLVSAGVMCSLILWVLYARERRHRVYAKQFHGDKYEPRSDE